MKFLWSKIKDVQRSRIFFFFFCFGCSKYYECILFDEGNQTEIYDHLFSGIILPIDEKYCFV